MEDKYAVYNRWGEVVIGGERTLGNVFDSKIEAEEYRRKVVENGGFSDEKFVVVKLSEVGTQEKLSSL